MINFSAVKSIKIPEGNVTMITHGDMILWQAGSSASIESLLIDFEYIDNGDGTFTLVSWKGTLNGVASTEMVIPNDTRIIF